MIMKLGRKVENTGRIRSENVFFSEVTMILGEKREIRDQSSFFFLENINFWEFLPRALTLNYPPLIRHGLLNSSIWTGNEAKIKVTAHQHKAESRESAIATTVDKQSKIQTMTV